MVWRESLEVREGNNSPVLWYKRGEEEIELWPIRLPFNDREQWRGEYKKFVYKVSGKSYGKSHPDLFKEGFRLTGITYPRFRKIVYKLYYKHRIEPVLELANLLCTGRGGHYQGNKIEKVWESREILEQSLNYGEKNLLPLIFHWEEPPGKIRKKLGRGLWKQLCSNSLHRNKKIVETLDKRYGMFSINHGTAYIKKIQELPSSLIFLGKDYRSEEDMETAFSIAEKLKKEKGIPWKDLSHKRHLLREKVTLHIDCKRMAEELEYKFKASWSLDKMRKMHDKYVEEFNTRKDELAKIPFKWVEKYPQLESFDIDGVEVTLLKSKYELMKEGREMHHCVGSYGNVCKEGSSLIFSLKKGEQRSTLQISQWTSPERSWNRWVIDGAPVTISSVSFRINQHKAQWNKEPIDELKECADTILEKVKEIVNVKRN